MSRFSFSLGALGAIHDFLIPPAISDYSKLQGKFMPTFFCVIKLACFYAFQVILIDRIPVKKEPCLTLTLMDERQDTKP